MNPAAYHYDVGWSEDDQQFVGVCAEFSSLSYLADTADEALTGIRQLVWSVLSDMRASGEAAPRPR